MVGLAPVRRRPRGPGRCARPDAAAPGGGPRGWAPDRLVREQGGGHRGARPHGPERPSSPAAAQGHCATLDALEQYGADINAADANGDTAPALRGEQEGLAGHVDACYAWGPIPTCATPLGTCDTLGRRQWDVSVMQELLEYGGSVRKAQLGQQDAHRRGPHARPQSP